MIKIRDVMPGVTQIDCYHVNIWMLSDSQTAMIIDTGVVWMGPMIHDAIERALGGRKLTSIVLTHGHTDHAGNMRALAETHRIVPTIHRDDAPFVTTRTGYSSIVPTRYQRIMFDAGEILFPVPRVPQVVCVHDRELINSPIGALRVIHSPGHAPGLIALWQEDRRLLLSGDVVINVVPFENRVALHLPVPAFSYDMELAKQSARSLCNLPVETLLPGHGPPILRGTDVQLRAWADRGFSDP